MVTGCNIENKRNTEYFIYKVENKYHTRVVWSIIIKASTKRKKSQQFSISPHDVGRVGGNPISVKSTKKNRVQVNSKTV
mgnify:CR=1 FL=1